MLSPQYLEQVPDAMVELYAQAERDILADMARRISAYDFYIVSAQHQRDKLIAMGLTHDEILERLAGMMGITREMLADIMLAAGAQTLQADDAIYRAAGLSPAPLNASPAMQAVLVSGLQKTDGLFTNLTRTTANTATKQFEDALDRAYMQVSSSAFSHTEAVRMAVKDLARRGIATTRYPSGHVDYIETSVRRATLTGITQTCGQLQIARADEMNCDLVEVSAHSGARPEHAEWQGKVYSRSGKHRKYPDFVKSTGYGTGAGLCGWNCRHSFYPFFEGLSKRAYTERELRDMEAKKYEYNGQKMTEYEATQKQRHIERQIRKWKREEAGMEAAGLPAAEAKAKVAAWRRTQRDFLKQTGLKRQYDREFVGKARRSSGLGAGNKTNLFAAGSVPPPIEVIDVSDTKQVKSKIAEFEATTIDAPNERAYVILKDGKTYLFEGGTNEVHPEVLEDALAGATVTHNHPAGSFNEYSFSNADINLFMNYELSILRGVDEKYIYEFSRNPLEIDSQIPLGEVTEFDARHGTVIIRAKELGIGYRRWKREQ